MSLAAARLPHRAAFLGVNGFAALAIAVLVVLPVAHRFSDRRTAMAEDLAETRRLVETRGRLRLLSARLVGPGDPALPTGDDSLGSADLQAMLQDAARAGGASFLGVRGVPASRRPDLRLVAARLEVEGPPAAIAATLRAIEDHVPLLWVTAAVLRGTGGGPVPGAALRAELQVEAALSGAAPGPAATGRPDGSPGR
ncbi:type II secretion system protein GspM [Lichenibacterium ramalinae]|uniref:General secretion pathway protein GspM n=1 Tax=Lichenibacterium ramalinae TaxID=2316527 RepID=A0A4Q2RF01_9HYPH|nr:type II secretion system protein GspM [Lichenibacterium ramalinae]RYB04093.1 hypothetical protein D3272_13770 [Lichenibacterium ramalinae]